MGACLGVSAQVSDVGSALATEPERTWRELAAPFPLPRTDTQAAAMAYVVWCHG
jgi:hypothetical protein